MAQTVDILLRADDRAALTAILDDRNRPQKHVQRARIVLLSADRLSVVEVARQTDLSRPAVWRWQQRFAEKASTAFCETRRANRVGPHLHPPPSPRCSRCHAASRPRRPRIGPAAWSPKAVGISLSAVQRIWDAHRLQPHRIRTFKRSNDPAFAAKVEDIVGLYMNPPAHAVVVSIDEKSQIQALDRTQPGLPLKPGRCGTMTHDYKRHGTTTLFAALNILDGTVVGRCMPKHTHQEFIKFLNAVERAVPAGKLVHAIADNYATHKHPKVKAWLAEHPRWIFHFTPTSASWINAVEGFFSAITRKRIRRGVFTSLADLQDAIRRYIRLHNREPKPFVWTKPADGILAKLSRLPASSD